MTGALIGYMANRLAVKMVFWPKETWYIAGIRVPFTPGILTRRRREFARAIAETLVERFCSPSDIVKALGQALDAGLMVRTTSRLDSVTRVIVLRRLESLGPAELAALAAEISSFVRESNTVTALVESNIEAMSSDDIERMVREVCGNELRSMAFFDAGVGFTVGCVQGLVTLALSS